MDAILGSHNTDRAFQQYLDDWRAIMADRIDQCRTAFSQVHGVHGLILAGSNGAGAAWPLSDIDLIPIYAPADAARAAMEVDRVRLDLLARWSDQGWRTGVDVGKLAFTTDEVIAALDRNEALGVLNDERWYHSIDKGYRGRALIDPDGLATQLADWFTAWRFQLPVVERRLQNSREQASLSLDQGLTSLPADRILAYRHLLKGIQWGQIHLMEGWGERDNSLGRFGTHFELAAMAHGAREDVDAFNQLASLTAQEVDQRLTQAPTWVDERLDRSWRARFVMGDEVTTLQNQRDVLRVSTDYELREVVAPPYAAWLAVPSPESLKERILAMPHLIDMAF